VTAQMRPAWTHTAATERLGLSIPIIQGPFGGGLSSIALTSAVAEAGGLGSFGAHHLDADGIAATANAIRARTQRPFALNLWLPFEDSEEPTFTRDQYAAHVKAMQAYFDELDLPPPAMPARYNPRFEDQLEAVIAARPAAFSFVFGVPDERVLDRCRALGIVTIGTATTVAEAVALDAAGVDLIVASAFEAGGHRVAFLEAPERSLIGAMALIPQVVDAVSAPVIAAGGIADGRGMAAAFMLGAAAVQIGTAFLACEESGTSELHRRRLFSSDATDTALTRVFSGRLARGIRNRLIEESDRLPIAPYPIQNWLMGQLKSAAIAADRGDLISLWAGQSAPLLVHRACAPLIEALVKETTTALRCDCRD